MKRIIFLCLGVILTPTVRAEERSYDIVVYGGTSAAVTTAVQARKLGKTVAIVCPENHLGGLTSSGLGWTDSGKKEAIGGISRDFYHRVWKHYQKPQAWRWQPQAEFGNRNQGGPSARGDGRTMWVFEPHVAEAIFEELIAEHEIPVFRDQWLDRTPLENSAENSQRTVGVVMEGRRIKAIATVDGNTYVARAFVDATYEGDLLAAAGVSFHVGREANSVYDEQWNGIQVGTLHHKHWFNHPVDPYRVAGDPASGLLAGVSAEPPGVKGEGDHRVQAYCFRMCLSKSPENRVAFPKPDGYDADQYALLLRVFDYGWREAFEKFDMMPNYKTDTNNHGPFSTDFIGENYDYPEASYERRAEIVRAHEIYQKGMMYFLANDPRVPAEVQESMNEWGLPTDEFKDNGGWPHQIYVREARRMIGSYVMTEHDCLDSKVTPDSIGMGSYTLDSHNVQRYITPEGFVQNEGDIGVHTPRPYEIALGAILPKRDECENLVVPVCVSSSHIAFGSIRMEPVFMILGHSAATVLHLALERDQAVQEVEYASIRKQLLEDGQVLELEERGANRSRSLPGVVVDDRQAELLGNWQGSSTNPPFVDSGYHHNGKVADSQTRAVYRAELAPGRYEVRLSWSQNANRASNVPVLIQHKDQKTRVSINQKTKPGGDGLFHSLGKFDFGPSAVVEIGTQDTDGYVILDSVQFLPISE
ncbi:FAD-dependent oxidoreductase [Aureliella helgolandensis]|uniref:Xanthan lyase n=1 Tax=Aureliella helgolandensis TaxID=2527968 RepID=A0A518G7X1_9BACT|nr:FAD-dependent oxidoreductase [Aureliella helgolandensis]QDV24687.1 Xanthan lyase precursor [Aureliella helgolandensis]